GPAPPASGRAHGRTCKEVRHAHATRSSLSPQLFPQHRPPTPEEPPVDRLFRLRRHSRPPAGRSRMPMPGRNAPLSRGRSSPARPPEPRPRAAPRPRRRPGRPTPCPGGPRGGRRMRGAARPRTGGVSRVHPEPVREPAPPLRRQPRSGNPRPLVRRLSKVAPHPVAGTGGRDVGAPGCLCPRPARPLHRGHAPLADRNPRGVRQPEGRLMSAAAIPNDLLQATQILLRAATEQVETVTLGRAWDLYAGAYGTQVRSFDSDVGRMKHLTRILGADRQLAMLSLADVDAYRAQRRTETTCRGGTPSVATLNREVEVLARVVAFAVSRKLLRANPLGGLQYPPEHNIREVVVDDALLERILAACKSWLRTFVLVAIDSGCRRNELVRLRWDEIDQERGLIRVETNDTKTRKGRVTILSARARESLLDVPRRSQWVFSNQHGDHFHPAAVTAKFRQTLNAAGITDAAGREIVLHDLR